MAPSENRIWQPSPSPVDSSGDMSGGNEDGEWPVKAVVGEEIRLDGTSRYEVRWDNWHRRDGSNTTWETERFDGAELVRRWNRKQKHLRASCADMSLDMKVSWPDDAVHKRITDQRAQAYEEKLERKHRTGPISTADWDAEIEQARARLQEPEIGEASSKLRVRRSASRISVGASTHSKKISSSVSNVSPLDQSISAGPQPKRGRGRPRIHTPPPSSPPVPVSAIPLTSTHKGKGKAKAKTKATLTPSSAGSSRDLENARRTLPSVIVAQPTLRGRISSAWNKIARETMAATVRISPDISDDKITSSIRRFRYLEKGYIFRDQVVEETFHVSPGAFTRCECTTCSGDSECSCRDLSKIYGSEDEITAYSKGLFTFEIPRGVDVIECNKYCGCGRECGNRVAQRARTDSIEIFDTNKYGWGVRALNDIPRGKVIGTYSGMLIRRDTVNKLPAEHLGYLFDLDSTEVKNSVNLGEKYTVNCYEYGNWTRFVNHSCSPNMVVYCVVYDTIAYVNMPYVAFVASVDILAGTELTIDYYPHANEDKKGKRSANGGDCRCGSRECRGWLRMA